MCSHLKLVPLSNPKLYGMNALILSNTTSKPLTMVFPLAAGAVGNFFVPSVLVFVFFSLLQKSQSHSHRALLPDVHWFIASLVFPLHSVPICLATLCVSTFLWSVFFF